MPKKYFVTRHRGAITWAANGGVKARKVETENFDTSIVVPGDVVMGTLPVHLAAQVNARGGHYWHLSMDIPVEHRSTELSALQMAEFGARLEEFRLVGLGVRVSSDPDIATEQSARSGADLHICIASGEALANYIPLAALTWSKVRIYASKQMKNQAIHLQGLVEDLARKRGVAVAGICEVVALPAKEDWHSLARFAAAESAALCDSGISLDLNLSGGTKPMSMAFAEAFQTQARRLYCATDVGELQFLDTLNTPPQALAPDLIDLKSYLAAQAWAINRCVVEGDETEHVMAHRQNLTASMVLSHQVLDETYAQADFIEVVAKDYSRRLDFKPWSALRVMHHIAAECAPRSHVKRPKPFEPWVSMGFAKGVPNGLRDLFNALQELGVVQDVRIAKPQKGNPNAPVLHTLSFCWAAEEACTYAAGGYLEEYVWMCLRALNLPSAHYGANVAVSSYDFAKHARADSEFNEMDIALVWNNRLLAVECKAGVQLTTGKDQEIINKLDSIKDNMGGAKGHAWLVTPLEVTEKRVLERAKRNRITLMHGPQVMKDLAKHLASHIGVELEQPWPVKANVRLFKAPTKPAGSR